MSGNRADSTTAATVDVLFDAAGVRATRRSNESAKRSVYPASPNERDYDVLPYEPLFSVAQRGVVSSHMLVRSNAGGLGWEATREFEGSPRQAAAARGALKAMTRFRGLALTESGLGHTDQHISLILAGPASAYASKMGRPIVAGDKIVFDFPEPGLGSVGPAQPGTPETKLLMQARAYDPLFVARDIMNELQLVLNDAESWRRAMGTRSKASDVRESLARTLFSAKQVLFLMGLREAMRADWVTFTPSFLASVPAAASIETQALADGTAAGASEAARLNAADAGIAIGAEWLGLTTNRVYQQTAAGRRAWLVFSRNLAGAMAYDGSNGTYEFGATTATATGLPANRSRYERSKELRQGDPYGDLATLQMDSSLAELAAIGAYYEQEAKNVAGIATSTPDASGLFNLFLAVPK